MHNQYRLMLNKKPDGLYLFHDTSEALSVIDYQNVDNYPDASYCIKMNNKHFLFAKTKKNIKGEGHYGQVFNGLWLGTQQQVIVKCQFVQGSINQIVRKQASIKQEYNIAKRLGLALAYRKTNHIKFQEHYIVMPNLGQPLLSRLQDKTLSQSQRLDWAIQACLQVMRIHQGRLNNCQHPPYAHRDIKPENFVIDAEEQLHIVDFGFAEPKSNEITRSHKGSPRYLPTINRFKQGITSTQIDHFALRRTLYLPEAYHCFHPRGKVEFVENNREHDLKRMILSPEQVEGTPLERHLNTGTNNRYSPLGDNFFNNSNARYLAALLILIKLNLYGNKSLFATHSNYLSSIDDIQDIISFYEKYKVEDSELANLIHNHFNLRYQAQNRCQRLQSSINHYLETRKSHIGFFGFFWNIFSIRGAKIILAQQFLGDIIALSQKPRLQLEDIDLTLNIFRIQNKLLQGWFPGEDRLGSIITNHP